MSNATSTAASCFVAPPAASFFVFCVVSNVASRKPFGIPPTSEYVGK